MPNLVKKIQNEVGFLWGGQPLPRVITTQNYLAEDRVNEVIITGKDTDTRGAIRIAAEESITAFSNITVNRDFLRVRQN